MKKGALIIIHTVSKEIDTAKQFVSWLSNYIYGLESFPGGNAWDTASVKTGRQQNRQLHPMQDMWVGNETGSWQSVRDSLLIAGFGGDVYAISW